MHVANGPKSSFSAITFFRDVCDPKSYSESCSSRRDEQVELNMLLAPPPLGRASSNLALTLTFSTDVFKAWSKNETCSIFHEESKNATSEALAQLWKLFKISNTQDQWAKIQFVPRNYLRRRLRPQVPLRKLFVSSRYIFWARLVFRPPPPGTDFFQLGSGSNFFHRGFPDVVQKQSLLLLRQGIQKCHTRSSISNLDFSSFRALWHLVVFSRQILNFDTLQLFPQRFLMHAPKTKVSPFFTRNPMIPSLKL